MKYRHFGKDNHKKALLRGMVISVIKNGGIKTNRAKVAKVQQLIDRLVTIAKVDNITSRRRVSSILAGDRGLVTEFFNLIPAFSGRNSGYTRTINLGKRKGDATEMARLEWVDSPKAKEKVGKAKKEETQSVAV